MTHRDGFPRLSAISVRRGDAGHREASATLSESLGKPPFRSSMRPARGHGVSPFLYSGGRPRDPRGRRKALTMPRIAGAFPPTRRAAWTIPMGHYYRSLVLGSEKFPQRFKMIFVIAPTINGLFVDGLSHLIMARGMDKTVTLIKLHTGFFPR